MTRAPLVESRSPHRRLVMAMLARDPSRWAREGIAECAAQVSWPEFLADTDERVRPFLHAACAHAAFKGVLPLAVMQALEEEHRRNAMLTLRRTAELRAILDGFATHGVAPLLLKGAALQRTVYPASSTRPMGDLDLFVRREEVGEAQAVLASCGFSLRTSPDRHTPQPGMQVDDEIHFVKPVGESLLLIELHGRLDFGDERMRVSPAPVADLRRRFEGSDGVAFDALEPEAALRHLCIHLAQHHGFVRSLLWLLDLRLFLDRRAREIDWSRFVRDSTPESLPYIALALTLARDWLGAEVGDEVTAVLRPGILGEMEPLVWGQVWDCVRTRRPPGSLVLLLFAGGPRIAGFVKDRWNRWTTPVPGESINPLRLATRRFGTELRTYRAAAREGGFAWRSLRTASRSEKRAVALEALMSSARNDLTRQDA